MNSFSERASYLDVARKGHQSVQTNKGNSSSAQKKSADQRKAIDGPTASAQQTKQKASGESQAQVQTPPKDVFTTPKSNSSERRMREILLTPPAKKLNLEEAASPAGSKRNPVVVQSPADKEIIVIKSDGEEDEDIDKSNPSKAESPAAEARSSRG